MPAFLVSFEGPEGSGKTTQVELLSRALAAHSPLVVREPGGTPAGERIRELLLKSRIELSGETEMYLFMAARAELVAQVIGPALAAGRIVIADRYHDSTLAYQGGGRGVRTSWPASFPKPDLTFLLALTPEEGFKRQSQAGKRADRLESESLAFHRAVAETYESLAAAEPSRWTRLEATEDSGSLHERVLESTMRRLKERVA